MSYSPEALCLGKCQPGNTAARIAKGLDTDIQKIVAHMRFQANKANAPAGLADRLRILTS